MPPCVELVCHGFTIGTKRLSDCAAARQAQGTKPEEAGLTSAAS